MYLLRWLSVCLFMATVTANELLCDHPKCEAIDEKYFRVEDHAVSFTFSKTEDDQICKSFTINCKGKNVLNSPAMPRFISKFHVFNINLNNCPLQNASIKDSLAALNVTFHPLSGKLALTLNQFPSDQLTRQTFLHYENLTNLRIRSNGGNWHHPLPEAGFLSGITNLQSLHLCNVSLPAGEFSRFPQTIDHLLMTEKSFDSLPRTVRGILMEVTNALPGLRHLTLDQSRFTALESTNASVTTIQPNSSSMLETLLLLDWHERRIIPFEHCNALLSLAVKKPKVEELPERWVAACSLLKEVTLEEARHLAKLPDKLLDGATALERLTIRTTRIQTLPEKFLSGVPNLVELNLIDTDLRGPIPSGLFQGIALKSLSLSSNRLINSDLSVLSSQTSLTHLNLDGNDLKDFCSDKGYSSLQNLTRLKELCLRYTHVSQICQDWRENFMYLEYLKLDHTRVARLEFTDFIFNRDKTVRDATVSLSPTVEFVNFTRGNYEKALSTPGSGITFDIERCFLGFKKVNCDCDSYWLRRAMINSRVIRINNLTCKNGKTFIKTTPNKMCPGFATQE